MNARAGERDMKNHQDVVLLVEDDENDAFLMGEAFKAARVGARLSVARDGEEAIEYLSKVQHHPSRCKFPMPLVTLLDLKLPKVMGIDVLKWARRQPWLCGLTVIVFSSSDILTDIEEAYRQGANSYVVKPHSHEKRINLARAIKDYWFVWHSGLQQAENANCPVAAAA